MFEVYVSVRNEHHFVIKIEQCFKTLFLNCVGKQLLLIPSIKPYQSVLLAITDSCNDCHTLCDKTLSNEGVCVSDGIRAIVQLLNSEANEVKEVAAEALSSLTYRNDLNAQ